MKSSKQSSIRQKIDEVQVVDALLLSRCSSTPVQPVRDVKSAAAFATKILDRRIECTGDSLFGRSNPFETDFAVRKLVGEGGFGRIYKCKSNVDGRWYAVKLEQFWFKPQAYFNPSEVREVMMNEALVLARLDHENVCRYYNTWVCGSLVSVDKVGKRSEAVQSAVYPEPIARRCLSPHRRVSSSSDFTTFFNATNAATTMIPLPVSRDLGIVHDGEVGDASKEVMEGEDGKVNEDDEEEDNDEEQGQDDDIDDYSSVQVTIDEDDDFTMPNFEPSDSSDDDDAATLNDFSDLGFVMEEENDSSLEWSYEQAVVPLRAHQPRRQSSTGAGSFNGDHSTTKKSRAAPRRRLLSLNSASASNTSIGPLCTQIDVYIQMALYEGNTLQHWIEQRGNHVHLVETLRIFQQMVSGLKYIHSQGLIHRDIKPSNIFLTKDSNVVKIGDFGLAKNTIQSSLHIPPSQYVYDDGRHDDEVSEVVMSADPTFSVGVGTPLYSSPEQILGHACDAASDVYSLGIVLCEMFSSFSTQMERHIVLSSLRKGVVPTELTTQFPDIANLVQQMVHADKKQRLSCIEIEESDVFQRYLSSRKYGEMSTWQPVTSPQASPTGLSQRTSRSPSLENITQRETSKTDRTTTQHKLNSLLSWWRELEDKHDDLLKDMRLVHSQKMIPHTEAETLASERRQIMKEMQNVIENHLET